MMTRKQIAKLAETHLDATNAADQFARAGKLVFADLARRRANAAFAAIKAEYSRRHVASLRGANVIQFPQPKRSRP